MADSNPTLYASSFSESRSPPSTFHPISLRISLHRALTQDLSTYFHERSAIEEQYIRSLQKLSSRFDSTNSSSKDLIFSELEGFSLDPPTIDSQLGTSLNQVKKTLEQEVEQLVKSHSKWNKKLESTVQGPLRESLTKRDWEKWGQEEKRLQGDVREYESLVDKLSKAQTKFSKSSSKLLSTQSSLSTLGSSLTSSLPSFLNLSQSLEQSHVQLLKQSLTQYGTFSSDLGRDRMELGERLVQQVLAIDESVEMTEWALREGMKASAGGPSTESGLNEFGASSSTPENQARREREESNQTDNQSSLANSVIAGTGGRGGENNELYPTPESNNQRERTTSRLSTAPPVAPLPLPTTAQDDSRSINSSTTTPSKSKSKKLGSKLSSLLGGGKKDKQEKEKEKRDRSSSIPNSSRYSSFNDSNAPPVPTSTIAGAGTLSPPPTMERTSSNRSNGSDGLMGGSAANEGNGSFQPPLQPTTPSDSNNNNNKRNSLFPSLGGRTRSDSSGGGGGGLFRRGSRMNSIPDEYNETSTTNNSSSGYGTGAPFVAEPHSINEGARVDSEGFSVPPQGYDRAIGEGTGNRNLMDDDDEDDDFERAQNQRSVPKLNILGVSTSSNNSSSIPSLPASPVLPQESEEERLAALSAIKNSLGAPPSGSSSVAGGLNRRATARGRRSEAGSVPAPNRPQSMLPSAAGLSAAAGAAAIGGGGAGTLERRETDDDVPLATIQQQQQAATQRRKAPPPPSAPSAASPTSPSFPTPGSTPIASSINNPSRAMSILSTNSSITPSVLGGGGALARKDPFEGVTESGVRISIVEQINVLMKAGEVQKVLVTGEIGLSYRPTIGGQDEEPLVLRLTNHEQMEKTAPNSTYLTPTSSSSNEFTLSKTSLLSKNGQTVPVLKYQLRPTSSKDLVPLIVKPTWRCEPNLTRIIVVYSQNPEFSTFSSSSSSPFGDDDASSASASVVDYSDLKLEVPFNQGQITSFQSKPPSIGTLSPTNGALTFSLPPPKSSGAVEEKLLVSAQTEGSEAARVGNMNLKWRIEGKTIGRVGVEMIGGGEGVKEVRRELESGKYIIA
ncbi:hypothetical protein JCM5350_003575 [Sporobolomyces pararoseus]